LEFVAAFKTNNFNAWSAFGGGHALRLTEMVCGVNNCFGYTSGMKRRIVQRAEVARRIRVAIQQAGSQRAWAERVGVSPVFICNVLQGKRAPGPKVLAALGLRRTPESYMEG